MKNRIPAEHSWEGMIGVIWKGRCVGMRDWSGYEQVIVFGGSFDPPHWGHVRLPGEVRAKLGADVVAYVVAGRAPHKLGRAQTPAEHRLAMVRRALEGVEGAEIVEEEVERAKDGRPSYTVETLERLRARLGEGSRMRLLIGADQALTFGTWREPERIAALADPVVMVRGGESVESLLSKWEDEERRAWWARRMVEVTPMEVSSTQVRRCVAAGEGIGDLVPSGVAAYITEHGLYRGEEAGLEGPGEAAG